MARVKVLLALVLATVNVCQGQGMGGRLCTFKNNIHSPFYWPGEEDVCTDSICQQYPNLECLLAPDYIPDQIATHWPENITIEVMYLQQYFDTLVPPPDYGNEYTCRGVCQHPAERIKRIFTDIELPDEYTGLMTKKRWMCHVIGPNIYRRRCGGKCDLLYGSSNSYCVPAFTVSIDVWVFCEGVYPGCRKIKLDVPISCSCKEFQCNPVDRPEVLPKPPRLPDWAQLRPILRDGAGQVIDLADPTIIGIAGDPHGGINPGGQVHPGNPVPVNVGHKPGVGNIDPSLIGIAGPPHGKIIPGGPIHPGPVKVSGPVNIGPAKPMPPPKKPVPVNPAVLPTWK